MSESVLRKYAFLLLILMLLVFSSRPAAARSQSRFAMSGVGGGRAVLSFAAAPLLTMTPTPFHLILTDHSGVPLTGLQVRCDLDMPAMPMPENRPTLRESDGAYWGEAIFTMAGEWRATFDVLLPEGRREILLFDIGRVLLK